MESVVTVVIPSYNPGGYLIEALDSVFLQTYKRWSIIIVDDASTDDSLDRVVDYIDHRKVRLICNERNVGQSKSMNAALAQVTTPYLLQLDADDWLYPHALETLVDEARRAPKEVGLISGNINIVFQNEAGATVDSIVRKNRSFTDRYDFLLANASQWPRFYKTSALRDIGGWPTDDPYEGRYMEDKLVLYRLIEKYHFRWIDETLYYHRRHTQNQTRLLDEYREITEWGVRAALRRWGDRYEPEFELLEGWLMVKGLLPKNYWRS